MCARVCVAKFFATCFEPGQTFYQKKKDGEGYIERLRKFAKKKEFLTLNCFPSFINILFPGKERAEKKLVE
jgi:hypothetical protein